MENKRYLKSFDKNKPKRRGLQKTKFYCQICERQCLDENGFKCHIQSPSHVKHLKKKLEESNNNSHKLIDDYSKQLLTDFLNLLRKMHGEKLIGYNKFYQEYIKDKDHVHLNSTKWNSLTKFINYLKDSGSCRVEIKDEDFDDNDSEKYLIAYIDKSVEAVMRNKNGKERRLLSDEENLNNVLQEQIKRGEMKMKMKMQMQMRGKEEGEQENNINTVKLDEHKKIKISLGELKEVAVAVEVKARTADDNDNENENDNKNKNRDENENTNDNGKGKETGKKFGFSKINKIKLNPGLKKASFKAGNIKPKNVFRIRKDTII